MADGNNTVEPAGSTVPATNIMTPIASGIPGMIPANDIMNGAPGMPNMKVMGGPEGAIPVECHPVCNMPVVMPGEDSPGVKDPRV